MDWARALDDHCGWLRTVVLARVRDPHVVDELMQEIALVVLRQQAAPVRSVSAWLYRVAVRQVLLYRRRVGREQRRVQHYAVQLGNHERAENGNPLRWIVSEEQDNLVRVGLEQLLPGDREILLLKYTEDWSCLELAEHLGVTVTTVETRLYRAKARLRHELNQLDRGE